MLSFHSLAMNGGVLHVLECIEPQEVTAAASGYRFFGLDDIADLLSEAKSASNESDDLHLLEVELDRRYSASLPDDSALFERFELVLDRNRSKFAPV